jgi:hypothetical protein
VPFILKAYVYEIYPLMIKKNAKPVSAAISPHADVNFENKKCTSIPKPNATEADLKKYLTPYS